MATKVQTKRTKNKTIIIISTMSEQELKEIIDRHQHYLNQNVDGWKTMRADLVGADLKGANLREVILRNANLSHANLAGADLTSAYLCNADLRGANLNGANLDGADLYCADLRGANLEGACLVDAHVVNADLRCADLRGADMTCADFEYAILDRANIDEDEEYRRGVVLSEPIRGWKKCEGKVIVELEIPKGAIVFSINGRKCRTNRAKVISLSRGEIAHSMRDNSFTYEVGKELEILDFDMSYNVECSCGIHFFKTEDEAETY